MLAPFKTKILLLHAQVTKQIGDRLENVIQLGRITCQPIIIGPAGASLKQLPIDVRTAIRIKKWI